MISVPAGANISSAALTSLYKVSGANLLKRNPSQNNLNLRSAYSQQSLITQTSDY